MTPSPQELLDNDTYHVHVTELDRWAPSDFRGTFDQPIDPDMVDVSSSRSDPPKCPVEGVIDGWGVPDLRFDNSGRQSPIYTRREKNELVEILRQSVSGSNQWTCLCISARMVSASLALSIWDCIGLGCLIIPSSGFLGITWKCMWGTAWPESGSEFVMVFVAVAPVASRTILFRRDKSRNTFPKKSIFSDSRSAMDVARHLGMSRECPFVQGKASSIAIECSVSKITNGLICIDGMNLLSQCGPSYWLLSSTFWRRCWNHRTWHSYCRDVNKS